MMARVTVVSNVVPMMIMSVLGVLASYNFSESASD